MSASDKREFFVVTQMLTLRTLCQNCILKKRILQLLLNIKQTPTHMVHGSIFTFESNFSVRGIHLSFWLHLAVWATHRLAQIKLIHQAGHRDDLQIHCAFFVIILFFCLVFPVCSCSVFLFLKYKNKDLSLNNFWTLTLAWTACYPKRWL